MFDIGRSVTVKATVIDFQWVNPHIMIYAGAKDDKGALRIWSIKLRGSPDMVAKAGWNEDTIKPGDELTFFGHPAKNGSDSMCLEKVVFPNGMELYSETHSWF